MASRIISLGASASCNERMSLQASDKRIHRVLDWWRCRLGLAFRVAFPELQPVAGQVQLAGDGFQIVRIGALAALPRTRLAFRDLKKVRDPLLACGRLSG